MSDSLGVKIADFVATGAYSGRSPIMPGTCGTLAAMALLYLLLQAFPFLGSLPGGLALTALATAACVLSANIVCRSGKYGQDAHDPQAIVMDEFAGYFLTVAAFGGTDTALLWGFLLFRIFDMSKPPPIKLLERLPEGWGIVADDLGAGVFAALALWALQTIL